MTQRIHLDTDFGGDPDDACALAMLLGWPDIDITGITTSADRGGLRAAYVHHLLHLAGRDDIPVAAGAEVTMTSLGVADPVTDDERHWPTSLTGAPSAPGAALDLLQNSIEQGGTIIAIGSCTNLAMLEIARAGSIARAAVVVMGGWITPPDAGLPAWGPEMDWNVQWDTHAASIVASTAADLTLATLPATMKAHLRHAHLPRLRQSGRVGALLARQAAAYGPDAGMPELGRSHTALPDDLLNFHYDPVACAIALGWPGATVESMRLSTAMEDGILRFVADPDGRQIRVLTDVDGPAFEDRWLSAIEAIAQ